MEYGVFTFGERDKKTPEGVDYGLITLLFKTGAGIALITPALLFFCQRIISVACWAGEQRFATVNPTLVSKHRLSVFIVIVIIVWIVHSIIDG